MNIEQNMGVNSSSVFSGKGLSTIEKMYGESAALFAQIIRENLNDTLMEYRVVDLGAHRGDLLRQLLNLLPAYNFHTIALEKNKDDLDANNVAQERILMDSPSIPLKDKSIDVLIARYVIHWNSFEDQKKLVKEMARVTKKIIIIQHAGPNDSDAENYRKSWDSVFVDKKNSKLTRNNFFSSSDREMESFMRDAGLFFTKVDQKLIPLRSDIYKERYVLNPKQDKSIKFAIGQYDYTVRTTWVARVEQ